MPPLPLAVSRNSESNDSPKWNRWTNRAVALTKGYVFPKSARFAPLIVFYVTQISKERIISWELGHDHCQKFQDKSGNNDGSQIATQPDDSGLYPPSTRMKTKISPALAGAAVLHGMGMGGSRVWTRLAGE